MYSEDDLVRKLKQIPYSEMAIILLSAHGLLLKIEDSTVVGVNLLPMYGWTEVEFIKAVLQKPSFETSRYLFRKLPNNIKKELKSMGVSYE